MPWRRVRDARLRLEEVRADSERVRRQVAAVTDEVALNDWTATAKRIFGGRA